MFLYFCNTCGAQISVAICLASEPSVNETTLTANTGDWCKVCSISHRIWSQIYRIQNQIRFQFQLVWFQFCFAFVSNLKLKRNMFVNAVSKIRIHRIYSRLVSFFCESIWKPKPESGLNPDKSNTYVLEKPKQTVKTNSRIRETKTRFMKPQRNRH